MSRSEANESIQFPDLTTRMLFEHFTYHDNYFLSKFIKYAVLAQWQRQIFICTQYKSCVLKCMKVLSLEIYSVSKEKKNKRLRAASSQKHPSRWRWKGVSESTKPADAEAGHMGLRSYNFACRGTNLSVTNVKIEWNWIGMKWRRVRSPCAGRGVKSSRPFL